MGREGWGMLLSKSILTMVGREVGECTRRA